MKYTRRIEIENWLIQKEHIDDIGSFLEDRFEDEGSQVFIENIEVKLSSGNNPTFKSFGEFKKNLDNLIKTGEIIESITIMVLRGTIGQQNKSITFKICFRSKEQGASIYVLAEDKDGSFSDWVSGTEQKLKNLKSKFEETDHKIKNYLSKNNKLVMFDLFGSIKEKILSGSKAKNTSYTILNINSNNFNNNGQIGGESNTQNNVTENKNYFKEIVIGVVIIIVGTIIVSFLEY